MATLAEPDVAGPAAGLQRQFRREVLEGLAGRPKSIPARWFYDHRGSQLFEEITALPEYYPTRTEIQILRACRHQLARTIGRGRQVVEFGAGSLAKTPLLLEAIDASGYVPVDISGQFLRESCEVLERRFPDLPIRPIEADFTRPFNLSAASAERPPLGFFPGSTIGNMEPAGAVDLLRAMRETLGEGALLLIGMDRIKDREVLLSAYADAAGVTAAFNLNLISRINRELEGTIPLDALRHHVLWNDRHARIEMHLKATRTFAFEVAGRRFAMAEGETIHTENSHKYDDRSAALLLLAGGWEPIEVCTDPDAQFMVVLARAVDGAAHA